ncbi:response regulator [Lentzea sp. BCCO 10_0061]|uniref:histidine kinase n=1 Tax=Lentzea sokolovensis TaxID=3095429 RepID=A0ABU4V699_9PSEU|nr:ATP-binding protein [Lentzea sp. BCCO 10_0061]MDX8147321.1 response regulator [Lentzea sp. BCCO 10_0061]
MARVGLFTGDEETSAAHRGLDWGSTSLGPVESWPVELRSAVRTVMPSQIPMLLWWGPDLVQIFNHAYMPVLGDKFPAAVGQRGSECWAEVWDELAPLADRALSGCATYSEKLRLLLRRHGYLEETYWTFSYSPVHTDDGGVAGIFVATTDVTAQVLSERRLESLHRLGMVTIAEADTPADVCRAAVEVLANNRPDVPAVKVYLCEQDGHEDLVATSGEIDVPDEIVRQAAETGRTQYLDHAVVAPLQDASAVTGVLVLGLSPLRAFDDLYAGYVDLVAAKVAALLGDAHAYAAERARAEALSELAAAKNRFFQNISHEFRTPLTLLLAPLGALVEDETGERRETLAAAHRAALRLNRLVDDLLDVARAESDRLHARPEPTDLAELTEGCVSMCRATADGAGLALTVSAEPITAAIDQEMWARIVLNLVSNAIKFTDHGAVTVTLRRTDGQVVLAVADTGAGIPPGEQDRVFDRFHQVEGPAGRSRGGTGIGLALVADLSGALGGQVELHSRTGEGSTFTVTIPYVPADVPVPAGERIADLGAAFAGEERRQEPVASRRSRTEDERRILLVEDNADLRAYLVRLLTGQGWTVDASADAETALDRVHTARPDPVLTDVMLPGRDGLALLGDLRGDQELARLPVILLTARAGAESTVDGLRLGADDYVVKPFDPAELIARVRVHLELSRFRETLIARGERQTETLRTAVATRGEIGKAMGILMVTRRWDGDTAFQHLVSLSQRSNTKLHRVAEDVLADFTRGLETTAPGAR